MSLNIGRRLSVMLLLPILLAGTPADPSGGGSTLPRIEGWSLTVHPTVYTRENLWDLIDGAADLFLAYEFVDLTIGDYRNGGGAEVGVELYRHATAQDAFGMYAAERQSDYRFEAIGTQGYGEEGILNFLAGEYYAKLTTSATGSAGSRALSEVARSVVRHLNRPPQWPAELALLPTQDRIPNSEGFVRKDFLGYGFLGSAFTARYGGKQEVQAFVIAAEDPASAQTLGRKLLQAAGSTAGFSGEGIAELQDPNNGPLTLIQTGRFLAGIVGPLTPPLRDQRLSQLRQSLQGAP